MDLLGKIINNCYIIREKVYEDNICTVWLSNTLFAAKIFLLKFFKNNVFKLSQKDFLELKNKMLSPNNYIIHENIANILEFDEYENTKFIAMEITEGNNLYNHIYTRGNFSIDETIKILSEISKAIEVFHAKNIPYKILAPDNIWINIYQEKIVKIKILNFNYHLLKDYNNFKNIDDYKNFIKPSSLKNKNNNINDDLYSIGAICYFALTGEFPPAKINIDHLNKILNDNINKNKLIKIIIDLLNKETSPIKTIYDLINQLPQLNQKIKSRDMSFKKEVYTPVQTSLAFKDMFEVRRKYFEDLENERRKKLNMNIQDNIFIKKKEIKKEVVNLGSEKIRQLEERKAFYRNESGEYFKKLNEKRKNHLNSIVNHTRNYYKNLNTAYITEEKFIEECKIFFNKISDQMKKYADEMKNENIKYFKTIMKKSNLLSKEYDENDIKEEYKEKLNEAKLQLNKMLEEAKKYYINLTEEAKKYHITHFTSTENKRNNNRLNTVLDETLNYYKNIEKESKDYYNSIIQDYKKSLNEINKRLSYLKENREMLSHFNENLLEAIVKNKFLKKLFKYSFSSHGNFCLIDIKQNKKAKEIINKYFNKYSLNSKSFSIELIANNNTIPVIFNKIYEKYKKTNFKKQEIIISKIKEIKSDHKNILDRNYHETLKDFIKVKHPDKKINNNLLVKSVIEFLKCFCFKKFPLIIIINEFHNIDIQCIKILFELTKDITSLPILIFGLYDRSKIERENFLNDIL